MRAPTFTVSLQRSVSWDQRSRSKAGTTTRTRRPVWIRAHRRRRHGSVGRRDLSEAGRRPRGRACDPTPISMKAPGSGRELRGRSAATIGGVVGQVNADVQLRRRRAPIAVRGGAARCRLPGCARRSRARRSVPPPSTPRSRNHPADDTGRGVGLLVHADLHAVTLPSSGVDRTAASGGAPSPPPARQARRSSSRCVAKRFVVFSSRAAG